MSYLADFRLPATFRRLLANLAEVVGPPQVRELDLGGRVAAEVELAMRAFSAGARAALVAGLWGYEVAAAAVPTHLGMTASRLSRSDAERYFRSWWDSPIGPMRELAKGAKGLICLSIYELPEIQQALDYAPEAWIERVTQLRAAKYEKDILRHRASLFAPDPLPGVQPRRVAVRS